MLISPPYLSEDEFHDGCQALQKRCYGRLDDTKWLDIRWQQSTLLIRKAYHINTSEGLSGVTETHEEEDLPASLTELDWEDEQALLRHAGSSPETIIVDFSVIRSPTYQVPVLWFSLQQLPRHGPSGLDAVYQYLVPDLQKSGVRQVGILGGISMAHHPISDLPAFFIHPCNTAEALQELSVHKNVGPEDYILVWLGLIGTAVNLHVPSKLLEERRRD